MVLLAFIQGNLWANKIPRISWVSRSSDQYRSAWCSSGVAGVSGPLYHVSLASGGKETGYNLAGLEVISVEASEIDGYQGSPVDAVAVGCPLLTLNCRDCGLLDGRR